ncbi:MAG: 4-(cytidine 5'-diphospho)-2-C-methyl-D-erythritol kinase [Pseudomonadota bacterium]
MTKIIELAPAKVNLYLHVGGLRPDGLHDLASCFVFVDVGDIITVRPASELSLSIDGPFSDALANDDINQNLILLAARELQQEAGLRNGAEIILDKRLPVAAGIGGGSADAAAAIRALTRLWSLDLSYHALEKLAFRLGADVPACLSSHPCRVGGAGEVISSGSRLPPLWLCLINPRVPTPTGAVFRSFDQANPNPPSPEHVDPTSRSLAGMVDLMAQSRNDLETAAIEQVPVIQDVLSFLSKRPGQMATRMSGSGATCFAVFGSREAAKRAASAARSHQWWSSFGAIL